MAKNKHILLVKKPDLQDKFVHFNLIISLLTVLDIPS